MLSLVSSPSWVALFFFGFGYCFLGDAWYICTYHILQMFDQFMFGMKKSTNMNHGTKRAVVVVVVVLCMILMMLMGQAQCDLVTIVNKMYEPLNLHCQSKDTDLGARTLARLEQYSWSFDQDFIGTTLYDCDFSAAGFGLVHVDVFKGWAYKKELPCQRCFDYACDTNCFWVVMPSGFYCGSVLWTLWPPHPSSNKVIKQTTLLSNSFKSYMLLILLCWESLFPLLLKI